jgi:hypothetical protein
MYYAPRKNGESPFKEYSPPVIHLMLLIRSRITGTRN